MTDLSQPPTIADVRSALAEVAAAQRRVEGSVDGLDERGLRAPSKLPGWSRAHVVAHLANNAMAFAGMLSGVLSGDVIPQYPGGSRQREVDIEARSTLERDALIELLRWGRVQFEAAAGALDDDQWFADSETRGGDLRPAWSIVWSRWREVEVHHVDLDAGFGIDDWSPSFVEVALAAEKRCLVRRLPRVREGAMQTLGPDAQLLWSLMGREGDGDVFLELDGRAATIDDLTPWDQAGWMPGVPDRS